MVARPRWRPKPAPKPVEDGRLSTSYGATINPQPDTVVLGRFLCGESVSRALSATADPAKPSHASSTAIQTRMIGSRARAEVKTSRPPRARAEASQRMGTGGYEVQRSLLRTLRTRRRRAATKFSPFSSGFVRWGKPRQRDCTAGGVQDKTVNFGKSVLSVESRISHATASRDWPRRSHAARLRRQLRVSDEFHRRAPQRDRLRHARAAAIP